MKPTDCDGSVYICISGVCLGDSVFLRRFYSRPFTTGVDGSGDGGGCAIHRYLHFSAEILRYDCNAHSGPHAVVNINFLVFTI